MYLKYHIYKYSQHPVIRTLRGMKNMFEIANVRVIGRILYGRGFQGKNKFSRIIECSSYRMLTVYIYIYY